MELHQNSANLMDRLNSISYNSKSSHTTSNPSSGPQKSPNPLLSTSTPKTLSDQSSEMLDHSIDEFKHILTEICLEGNALLKKFQKQLPDSNLKRLEAMIPKLTEASHKVSRSLPSKNQQDSSTINVKREYQEYDDENDDISELQNHANGFKKVKPVEPEKETSDVILLGAPFLLTFICHLDIKSYLPAEKTCRYGSWAHNSNKSEVILKREDFLFLPNEVSLRLSKEHAKISAQNMGTYIEYELVDTSVNGTYYLGNRVKGKVLPAPMRLQKGMPFKLQDGDWFCLLQKKTSQNQTPEVLLGFEFRKAM